MAVTTDWRFTTSLLTPFPPARPKIVLMRPSKNSVRLLIVKSQIDTVIITRSGLVVTDTGTICTCFAFYTTNDLSDPEQDAAYHQAVSQRQTLLGSVVILYPSHPQQQEPSYHSGGLL